VKIKTLSAFFVLIVFNANVYAFGLGKIEVKSSLNDPFEATIELTGTLDFSESQMVVRLGSDADFQRMGVSREAILLQLTFEPELKSSPPVIVIRSRRPINEPVLNFILDVQSPKAQIMKEYTVFLNPAK
jgi:pilus assembly protein FimV